jgi:hypothetical protein
MDSDRGVAELMLRRRFIGGALAPLAPLGLAPLAKAQIPPPLLVGPNGPTFWTMAYPLTPTKDQPAQMAFSNKNLTITSVLNGGNSLGIANKAKTTGKWYFEITIGGVTNNMTFGIVDQGYNWLDDLGADTDAIAFYPVSPPTALYFNNVQLSGGSTAEGNGAVCGFAVDLGARQFWVQSPQMIASGNNWNNALLSASNPAIALGGAGFAGIGNGPYRIAAQSMESGNTYTLNTVAPFVYGIPAGFQAWT